MKALLVWVVSALVFTAAGGGVAFMWMHAHEKEGGEHAENAPTTQESPEGHGEAKTPERLTHDEAGNVVILVDTEAQTRLGVELTPLAEAVYHPELTAYGILQEDPALSFTVRTPLPGTVVLAPGGRWPALGEELTDGAVVGRLEPRLGPVEQADLAARLAGARADVQQAKAALEALQSSLESKRRLHDQGKIVSDQAVLEAESLVKVEEAKLKGTTDTVRILESFLSTTTTRPTEAIPLVVRGGGRVVETPISPGESVESGQLILKVSRFDRLLARISLPAGKSLDVNITKARVLIPGQPQPLTAERVAVAGTADAVTGGQTVLFSLQAGQAALQPGLPISARLELPGEPRKGVIVPRSAVIRVAGLAWVYVKSDAEKLTRRQMPVDTPMFEGWFVAEALKAGDTIVTRGAQTVLSEELSFGTKEEEE